MAEFKDRLQELRLERGLTQQALADMIHVHDAQGMHGMSISGYERGVRKPSFEVLDALADIFNVSLDYLLGNTDHRISYPQHGDDPLFGLRENDMPKGQPVNSFERQQFMRLMAYHEKMNNFKKIYKLVDAYDNALDPIKHAIDAMLDLTEGDDDGDS